MRMWSQKGHPLPRATLTDGALFLCLCMHAAHVSSQAALAWEANGMVYSHWGLLLCWVQLTGLAGARTWSFFFLFSSFMLHQSVQAPHKRTQGHLGRHSRTDCCLKCKTVFHSQWFDISWVSMGIEKYKASHWMWLRTHVLVSYFVLIVK